MSYPAMSVSSSVMDAEVLLKRLLALQGPEHVLNAAHKTCIERNDRSLVGIEDEYTEDSSASDS